MDTNHEWVNPKRQRDIFRGDAYQLYGARIGAVAAILTFITFYVLTNMALGPWIGIAIGWLPSAILAWTAAQVVAPLSTHGLRSLNGMMKTAATQGKRSRTLF